MARLERGLRQHEGPELLEWLKRRYHRIAIAKAAVEWHGPEVLAVLSEIFPIAPAIVQPRRQARPSFLTAAAFAGACVTLAIPVALLVAAGLHRNVYTSAPDATKRLTLSDGTRVELNHGTRINVAYAARARSVRIERGEALFKVASEPDSPFYIHVADRNFETGAATFDVRFAAPDRLSLTVLQGTVTVFPRPRPGNDKPILLEPLQMLVIDHDEESGYALTQQDVRARLAWQSGT